MRINCHGHAFNLRSLVSEQTLNIVRDRLERDLEPEWLAKAVTGILTDFVSDLAELDEEKLLRDLLDRIKKETAFSSVLEKAGFVPEGLRPLFESRLDRLALRALRRATDALVGLFRKESTAVADRSLFNVIDLVRLVARPDVAGVAQRLMAPLGPDSGSTLLVFDITKSDRDAEMFASQVRQTADLVARYPGRVFPLYGINPHRSDPAGRLEKAVEELGYVGVKIYPSMGWDPRHEGMDEVYDYCRRHDLPIQMHCNRGGFYDQEESIAFADPDSWRPVLDDFPGLKLCFAHFGGGGGLAKEEFPVDERGPHWGAKIKDLMEEHAGVYTDLAAHSAPMKNKDHAEVYFRNLKKLLATNPFRDRILFGTDFWVMRARLTESRHWRFFEENLTPLQFRQIAVDNPRRFLGLPDAEGGGASFGFRRYADRVVREEQELKGPVPGWLLDLIERRPTGGAAVRQRLEAAAERFEPAPGLVVKGWRRLVADLVATSLAEHTRPRLTTGEVELLSTRFQGSPIGLSGEASLSADLFNAADQEDEDGVLGVPATGGDGALALRPAVAFSGDRAWLKYRLAGKLRLEAEGQLSALGLDVDASKSVVFADYRAHPPGASLPEAVAADLSWPRFALRLSDVLRLKEDDALSFAARGTLEVGATASWSDVLTGGLSTLGEALGAAEPLVVRLDVGASVSARLSLTDDFRIVFARRRNDYRVGLVKSKARGVELAARIDATLQFDDPEAVEEILKQALEQRLGAALGRVRGLLAQSAEGELGPQQKNLLEKLEDRLGEAGLDAVRERVEELERDAREAIEKIATARLTAGFTYEYSRLKTDTTLLEATLSEDALTEMHHQLVAGDLSGLLFRAGSTLEAEGVSIDRYVVELRVEKRRAWGFTLGSSISGKGAVESELVEQEAILPNGEVRRRVAFLGSREYRGRWPGLRGRKEWGWKVDFQAQMPEFSGLAEPRTFEFDYGFALDYDWVFRRLTRKKLLPCLDAAALWGVFADDEKTLADRARLFEKEGLIDQPVTLRLQLVVGDEALMAILPEAATPDNAAIGLALGAAMPHFDDALRRCPATRRRAYGSLWEDVLDSADSKLSFGQIDTLAKTARERVTRQFAGKPKLLTQARQERDDDGRWRKFMRTFGGMLTFDNSPKGRWVQCRKGLEKIAQAEEKVLPGHHADAVKDMFKHMQPFWQKSHLVRAFGAYLLDHARRSGVRDQVQASLTAEVGQAAEGKKALILGANPS